MKVMPNQQYNNWLHHLIKCCFFTLHNEVHSILHHTHKYGLAQCLSKKRCLSHQCLPLTHAERWWGQRCLAAAMTATWSRLASSVHNWCFKSPRQAMHVRYTLFNIIYMLLSTGSKSDEFESHSWAVFLHFVRSDVAVYNRLASISFCKVKQEHRSGEADNSYIVVWHYFHNVACQKSPIHFHTSELCTKYCWFSFPHTVYKPKK